MLFYSPLVLHENFLKISFFAWSAKLVIFKNVVIFLASCVSSYRFKVFCSSSNADQLKQWQGALISDLFQHTFPSHIPISPFKTLVVLVLHTVYVFCLQHQVEISQRICLPVGAYWKECHAHAFMYAMLFSYTELSQNCAAVQSNCKEKEVVESRKMWKCKQNLESWQLISDVVESVRGWINGLSFD